MRKKLNQNVQAPDFELTDTRGNVIRLSAYRGKPVVLALLRGFT
jgi:peroxiredoxin